MLRSISTLLRLHLCLIRESQVLSICRQNPLLSILPFCLQSQKDPMLVEKIMKDLDSNKDNEVDFNEFVVLVAALTVACNDFFQEQNKK